MTEGKREYRALLPALTGVAVIVLTVGLIAGLSRDRIRSVPVELALEMQREELNVPVVLELVLREDRAISLFVVHSAVISIATDRAGDDFAEFARRHGDACGAVWPDVVDAAHWSRLLTAYESALADPAFQARYQDAPPVVIRMRASGGGLHIVPCREELDDPWSWAERIDAAERALDEHFPL